MISECFALMSDPPSPRSAKPKAPVSSSSAETMTARNMRSMVRYPWKQLPTGVASQMVGMRGARSPQSSGFCAQVFLTQVLPLPLA